jgi:hypothetical protein
MGESERTGSKKEEDEEGAIDKDGRKEKAKSSKMLAST